MELVLKRIKRKEFDDLMNLVIDRFESNGSIELSDEELEKVSENVLIGGKTIQFNYDIDEYSRLVNSDEFTYNKLAKIGMQLHKESKDVGGIKIPTNILYEKEVWTYISFKLFKDIILKLRLDDEDKITSKKIEQYFFNVRTRSRTGLLFIWTMIDMLQSENEPNISEVAFHFVDPVKAIYERVISRNPIVLRAFVEAIIKNDCDPKIANNKYRLKVPKNVNCFARISMIDTYEYDELVEELARQIKNVLSIV